MAGNTRRLPSWMMPSPPQPPPSVTTGDADVQQLTSKSNRGGRRKVAPANGNATKKRKAAKRDQSSASEASPHAVDVTIPIEPPDEDCSQLLTVEDLVSIAEEYVRAADEEGSEQSRSVNGECRSRTSSLGNDLLGVVTVNKQNSPANPCSSKHNPTTESTPIIVSTTGDPAQEMLNLFLGPLLSKPVVDEKR